MGHLLGPMGQEGRMGLNERRVKQVDRGSTVLKGHKARRWRDQLREWKANPC